MTITYSPELILQRWTRCTDPNISLTAAIIAYFLIALDNEGHYDHTFPFILN